MFVFSLKEQQNPQKTTEAACALIFDPSSNRSYYSSEITNGLSKWNKNDKYQKHISDIYTTIAGHSDSGTLLPRPPWSQQKTLMSFLLHFILISGREGVTRLCEMERSNIRKRKRNYFQLFWVFLFLHEFFSFSVCHTATWRGFGFTFNLTFSLAKGGSTCPGNEKWGSRLQFPSPNGKTKKAKPRDGGLLP